MHKPPLSCPSRSPSLQWIILVAIAIPFVCALPLAEASQVALTNLEGREISADLKNFDRQKREILLEKDGREYGYSLADLEFSSKIAALRTPEMQQVLSQKLGEQGPPIQLNVLLAASVVVCLLVLGLPTFLAAAFLITGQEGRGFHFKAWLKMLALASAIIGLRIVLLGGVQWLDLLDQGWGVLRPEDGLALVFALAGSVWLLKRHYHETLKLASTTLAVHLVFFVLLGSGIGWLVWRWHGADWQIPADDLLTRLVLRPFDLI